MEQENDKNIADYAEMDETTFWEIIEKSRTYSSEINDRFNRLGDLLRELSPKQIVGFRLTMDRLHDELGESSWYVYFDGLAEDERPSLYAIQGRIISMGEESYYNIKDKPTNELFDLSNDTWALDSVYNLDCSPEIFQEKTGEGLDKFIETYHRLKELEQNEQQEHDPEMEQ